ncbi:response regulator [Pseudobacteriovorax antillogorgiicola]|uniref:CheY chemotaxis protein or a CheY-like REC (Receiver) domain n=1 Tax=Pseudobacteriovorax antillogorgiicola TaxID=1513793 RepID=A0A1Y6CAJ7_9BACT|nr:response regulator [Pseudobacteriovorax antillogorgiicola]TCS48730.1 CheY-like chemotaxis protein [Pseudobacteriovorax antillogorgiicola]SMF54447.1 CheY chemotaxis protein or a CheY-like REC (receiver) domain [Pseudobacteriovorax antillogorgiicola]
MKVLIADDNPEIASVIELFLENSKVTFYRAMNSEDALNQASSNLFDLIITDYDFPPRGGLELISKYRNAIGNTPLYVLTGVSISEEDLLSAGATKVFFKPNAIKRISDEIKTTIKKAS